jgi:EAL domain-containing protein (putative c-di-GMP-specific phosphodiesterase class I)
MEVIAEGIETRKQFLELRDMGCHQGQGFLFSGPVGAAQAEDLIRDGYPLDLEAMRVDRAK